MDQPISQKGDYIRNGSNRALMVVLAAVAIGFGALRFVDLVADFPIVVSSSGAMYGDEGLYARNALALELTGDGYIPGEYNTAINYPVYTLMQIAAFKLFGSSLATLRGLSAVCAIGAAAFIFAVMRRRYGPRAATLAAALILMNWRYFVYSRFGNMDVPTTLFIAAGFCALFWKDGPLRSKQVVLCALAMFLGLMVKTSVLAGAAAAGAVILIDESNWRRRLALAATYVAVLVGCAAVYFALVLLPNWRDFRSVTGDVIDSRLTSGIGQYLSTLVKISVRGRMDIDWYFLPLALTLGPVLAVFVPVFRRDRLFLAALAWLVLHLMMMAGLQYHPPRYFAAAVVPTFIVIAIIFERAIRSFAVARPRGVAPAGAAALAILGLSLLAVEQLRENVKQVSGYYAGRKHTLADSAAAMKQAIEADKPQRIFVLSHGAATACFIMHVESIGEHLGPASRQEKIVTHQPTYYIRHCEKLSDPDETVDAFAKLGYTLEPMGSHRMLRDEIDGKTMHLFRVVKR